VIGQFFNKIFFNSIFLQKSGAEKSTQSISENINSRMSTTPPQNRGEKENLQFIVHLLDDNASMLKAERSKNVKCAEELETLHEKYRVCRFVRFIFSFLFQTIDHEKQILNKYLREVCGGLVKCAEKYVAVMDAVQMEFSCKKQNASKNYRFGSFRQHFPTFIFQAISTRHLNSAICWTR
jgi:hypothetical protein